VIRQVSLVGKGRENRQSVCELKKKKYRATGVGAPVFSGLGKLEGRAAVGVSSFGKKRGKWKSEIPGGKDERVRMGVGFRRWSQAQPGS